MGAYLSTPVRDKITVEGSTKSFSFGAASMQGWRISQEDAHNCCPNFDESTDTALFAVYDGHGGAEVAQYMAANFPDYLKAIKAYKEGNLNKALEEGFLGFDALLTKPEVVEQLQEIAGTKTDEADDEEMDVKEETKMLFEEAHMPLEKLLARYKTLKQAAAADDETDKTVDEKNSTGAIEKTGDHCVDKLCNGEHNNVNGTESVNRLVDSESGSSAIAQPAVATSSVSQTNGSSDSGSSKAAAGDESEGSSVVMTSADKQTLAAGDAGVNKAVEEDSEAKSSGGKSSSSSEEQSGASTLKQVSELNSSDDAGPTVCDDAGTSSGSSSAKGVLGVDEEEEEETSDSEDDDEEGDDWHAGMMDGGDDDEDDDDVEEEEEEDDDEDPSEDSVLSVGEEPGADSGCTAVVALLRGKQLTVANAGDSRCVLCRAGQAVDMSFDHKPESPVEQDRIVKAGGHITMDGRVNGGLNLSRAIGDHCYKRNTELPLHEQMITALPDLQTQTLTDEDEFILLACDGIWNMMSSQDAVTFVRDRLKAGQTQLTQICEEMFDYCLAPDTSGDGTGCDNMTAIIVLLKPFGNAPAAASVCDETDVKNKRSLEISDEREESANKRTRIDPDAIGPVPN